MHSYSIDWDQLKIVLTIARSGNLTKAGQVLGVNQSTVGRRLSALERQLDVALFMRSKTAMRPTEHGKTVIAEAEAMESALLNAVERVGKTKAEPEGLIRFVTMPWICSYVIAPHLAGFSRQYSSIEVQAVADFRERFLDRREVDIALRFEMQPRSPIQNIPVVKVPYAIYGPLGTDPELLCWIGFREDRMDLAPQRWLRGMVDDALVQYWANDAGVLWQFARNGLGKALLPEVLAAGDPKLTRISGPEPELERVLNVQYLPDIQRLKRVAVFLDWLSETLAGVFERKPA